MKRMVLAGLLLALAALGALAYLRLENRRDPVVLGYVSCLTGKFSALSGSGRDGAVLAVEHVNARGGVAGRRLELVVVDDGFNPETAGEAVKSLHAMGASAVIGPFASAMAQPMLDAATRAGALLVSPTVATDDLTGKDDLFIRLIPTTASVSFALGKHMAQARGLGAAVALADRANASYTNSAVANIREGFLASGGTRFEVVEYDSRTQPAFQKLAADVLARQPDGVALVASPLDCALAAQRLRMLDPRVPLFSSTWGVARELIQNGGGAVEGLESVVPFDPDSVDPAYLAFAAEFAGRFGREPDYASVYNYEAVLLLADALAMSPDARGWELARIILGFGQRPGLQGGYVLDGTGDVTRPMHLIGIQDGRLKTKR